MSSSNHQSVTLDEKMDETCDKTVSGEMDNGVKKNINLLQDSTEISKIDEKAGGDCIISKQLSSVSTSVAINEMEELKVESTGMEKEQAPLQLDNQGKNNVETALSGGRDLLEPSTSDQEVRDIDRQDLLNSFESSVSTTVGTDQSSDFQDEECILRYEDDDFEPTGNQEVDQDTNNLVNQKDTQSLIKDLENLTDTKNQDVSDSILKVSDKTNECETKIPVTEIDSETEQQLLLETTTFISDQTIEHQSNALQTEINKDIDDELLSEPQHVDIDDKIKTTIEEKKSSHEESIKDSINTDISTTDTTQVDKIPIPEFCSDSKRLDDAAENEIIDTGKLKNIDEMDVDKSNESIDSMNELMTQKDSEHTETKLSMQSINVTNITKDSHTGSKISLITNENETPLDQEPSDDLITTDSVENLEKTIEQDSKKSENVCEQGNQQSEHSTGPEKVSDIDMSQDISMEVGNKEHGLKQPNMMIEIPTQELINIDSIMGNMSDTSVNSEDNCEDISSLVDRIDSGNKETKNLTESKNQENSMETETTDSTENNISEGTIILPAFEVADNTVLETDNITLENKCSGDDVNSELPIEETEEIDVNQPEHFSSGKQKLSPSKINDIKQTSVLENSTVTPEYPETSKAETCSSVHSQDKPSLPDQHPTLDKEPLQSPITCLPSTSHGPSVLKEPTTSKDSYISMAPDTSDEVPEMSDSLGLLAESSRVMEDDEEQETSEHDDVDDDDDFDPDDGKFYLVFSRCANSISGIVT